jgi:hypothetical protein
MPNPKGQPKKTLTTDQKMKILEMRNQNNTVTAIMIETGLSRKMISNYIKS